MVFLKSGSVSDLLRMTSRLSLLRAVTFSYTPSSLFTNLVNPRSRNSLFVLGVLMLMHEMSLRKYPPQVGHRVKTLSWMDCLTSNNLPSIQGSSICSYSYIGIITSSPIKTCNDVMNIWRSFDLCRSHLKIKILVQDPPLNPSGIKRRNRVLTRPDCWRDLRHAYSSMSRT